MSIAMVDNSQVSFPPPQPQKSPIFFSWKRRGGNWNKTSVESHEWLQRREGTDSIQRRER